MKCSKCGINFEEDICPMCGTRAGQVVQKQGYTTYLTGEGLRGEDVATTVQRRSTIRKTAAPRPADTRRKKNPVTVIFIVIALVQLALPLLIGALKRIQPPAFLQDFFANAPMPEPQLEPQSGFAPVAPAPLLGQGFSVRGESGNVFSLTLLPNDTTDEYTVPAVQKLILADGTIYEGECTVDLMQYTPEAPDDALLPLGYDGSQRIYLIQLWPMLSAEYQGAPDFMPLLCQSADGSYRVYELSRLLGESAVLHLPEPPL